MTVAATTHRANGPLAANRGFELPLTNAAAAAALAAAGPGRFRLGPRMPRGLTVAAAIGGGILLAGSVAKLLSPARPQDDQPDIQPFRSATETAGNGQVTRTVGGNNP